MNANCGVAVAFSLSLLLFAGCGDKSPPIQAIPSQAITSEEIWLRPVKVEIDENSPLGKDDSFNKPPKVRVCFKKNGKTVWKSPVHAGWSVEFPNDDDHEVLMGYGDTDEYTIEVWDSQYRGDQLLFSSTVFKGSDLRANLTDPTTKSFEEGKVITFKHAEKQASVSLSYAGTCIWYRLVNVTIPPASPLRNDANLNHPPSLQVSVKSDGVYYGDDSTYHTGWTADFPKVASNCWAVREETKRRYTVEVWDRQITRWQLIFSVNGLSARQFERDSSVLERRCSIHQPQFPYIQRLTKPQDVPIPPRASLRPERQFSEYRRGDAHTVPPGDFD